MVSKPLTELENCVLAVIGRDGPCTRYHVMQVFESSQSSRWSSTAGSIYPLLARLEARALVGKADGGGRGRLYVLTADGREAVRRWLLDQPRWLASPSEDLMRTRSFFFDMLAPAERAATLAEWRNATAAEIVEADRRLDELRRAGDLTQVRSLDGARRQLQARLDWLNQAFE